MALLQKMRMVFDDGEISTIIHVVDEIHLGGEYTCCGLAIPDSTLNDDGYEHVGDEYKGSINKCTCNNCNRTIHYYKKLK